MTGGIRQLVGGLVGYENLLAVNRWATDATGTVTTTGLYSLGANNLVPIASGSSTLLRRRPTRDASWSCAPTGAWVCTPRPEASRAVTPASPQQVALQGNYLVVLTKARTLAVFDSRTGSLLKTLPVRGLAPRNLDVQANLAVYTVGRACMSST